MRVIKIHSVMWGTYPYKAISIATYKVKDLDRFLVKITDNYYEGTYLVQTKNLKKKDKFKYGWGWVIDVEDYRVLEPYTPPLEHDKMNLKDSFNNIIKSAKEMPEEEELATYEEIRKMCKDAQKEIREISRKKAVAV